MKPLYIPTGIRTSMYMAFVASIILPILETIRRWHQMGDLNYFMHWFDDYIIAGFLFFGAWKTYKSYINGQRFLIAAWSYAMAVAFMSFVMQAQQMDQPDPSHVSVPVVVMVKAILFLISLTGLILALKKYDHN